MLRQRGQTSELKRENQMKFISKDIIQNKMVRRDVSSIDVYNHFQKYEDEILYVVEDDVFFGIITYGDFNQYLVVEKDSFINQRCSCLESVDFDKAAIIFSGFNRYHEIPVVVEGKMLGIITNSQVTTKQEWDIIRASQYTGKYL